jgi:hypothetical protein
MTLKNLEPQYALSESLNRGSLFKDSSLGLRSSLAPESGATCTITFYLIFPSSSNVFHGCVPSLLPANNQHRSGYMVRRYLRSVIGEVVVGEGGSSWLLVRMGRHSGSGAMTVRPTAGNRIEDRLRSNPILWSVKHRIDFVRSHNSFVTIVRVQAVCYREEEDRPGDPDSADSQASEVAIVAQHYCNFASRLSGMKEHCHTQNSLTLTLEL